MSEITTLPKVPTREQIDALAAEMARMPQTEPIQTNHYFTNTGLYAREVSRKAGTLVVGKVHKKEHFFLVTQGEMTLWTEGGMKHVTAPFFWHSKPGTKRVTYAHTDATVMTFHIVSSQDLEKVEAELIEDDPTYTFGVGNVLKKPALEHVETLELPS